MDNNIKKQLLGTFIEQFFEFINDIQSVFPHDREIKLAKGKLFLIKKTNPKLLMSEFKESVTDKYSNEIVQGNIDFFIDKDYSTDLNSVDEGKNILKKIEALRTPIKSMNKEEQSKIVSYIQNLSSLCELYHKADY